MSKSDDRTMTNRTYRNNDRHHAFLFVIGFSEASPTHSDRGERAAPWPNARVEWRLLIRSRHLMPVIASLISLGCMLATTGCNGRQRRAEEAFQVAEQVQLAVQSFADEYVLRVKQAADELYQELESPRQRDLLSRKMLGVAVSSATIPTGANPRLNAVDLIVVTTLSYEVRKRTIPRDFGEMGEGLLAAYKWGNDEAWLRVSRLVTSEHAEELRDLIDEWQRRNPEVESVALIRFDDFVGYQLRNRAASGASGNIFSLLMIDPFAGLDPTNREIRESRLFAERAFYFAQRMPLLLSLQVRAHFDSLVASPTGQDVLASIRSITQSTDRFVSVAESLPNILQEERIAALDQAATLIEAERTAAIGQLGAEFKAQGDRLLESLAAEEPGVRDTLSDLHTTITSATELSESLQVTIEAAEAMTSSSTSESSEPLDLADVQSTLTAAHATVEQLNQLADSLDVLLTSEDWSNRREDYLAALARTEEAGVRIVDRAYSRLLIIVGALLAGVLIILAIGRGIGRRPRRGAA